VRHVSQRGTACTGVYQSWRSENFILHQDVSAVAQDFPVNASQCFQRNERSYAMTNILQRSQPRWSPSPWMPAAQPWPARTLRSTRINSRIRIFPTRLSGREAEFRPHTGWATKRKGGPQRLRRDSPFSAKFLTREFRHALIDHAHSPRFSGFVRLFFRGASECERLMPRIWAAM
jgi:hypothetical protein